MEAVLIPMKKFMDDIEIPDLVQSTVLKKFAIISDKGLKMSAQKLLDVRVAAQEAERLGELYSNDTLMELTYHLYAAFLCWDKIYVPQGISYEIYIDTMKCFTRFLEETRKIISSYKFNRGFWTWRYTSGLIYRIQELEFEMVTPPHKDKAARLAGKKYISVHIPSDANLSHEIISKNYLEAKYFLKKYFASYDQTPFASSTWLLSPKLKDWLKEESNLRLFADDYDVVNTNHDSDEGVPWVFNSISADILNYPEETSLQKVAKKWMVAGGHIGSALGILKEDIELT
ncbi:MULTISPECIES: acyltransferase domain-containing protein [Lactococcus]|uniref:acyltransferase domain-containing protein n=1 Tax=Lactococcus TaxID=1357 RepID=UPI00254C47DB|nr:acyltransferase domain-containing protein [Lactococcus petauri]